MNLAAFIDTPPKKRLMFSFVLYLPLVSLLSGSPLPLPSVFHIDPTIVPLFNGISLCITVLGAITGGIFYLEKRSKKPIEEQNKKIDKIDERIDEAVILTREDLKDIREDMKGMERRICNVMEDKTKNIEKNIDDKVVAAKQLEDERINNLTQRINNLEGKRYHGSR